MQRERESWQLSNWQLTRAVRRRQRRCCSLTRSHPQCSICHTLHSYCQNVSFTAACQGLLSNNKQRTTTTTTKHPYVALRYRQLPGELALAHFRCVINCDCHFAAFWEDFSAAAWSAEGWTPCTVPYPSLPLPRTTLHSLLHCDFHFVRLPIDSPFLCLLLALLLMQLHLTLVYLLG